MTAGLAAQAWWAAFGRPPAPITGAEAAGLVALPLAALLLAVAVAGIRGRALLLRGLRDRLDRAERSLRAVVDASECALIGLAPDGAIVDWPPEAETLFGAPASAATATTFDALVDFVDLVRTRQLFERVVTGGRPEACRAVCRRHDGTTFIAAASWAAIRDGAGALTGVSLTVRDVSDEGRSTTPVAASERQVAALTPSALDAVIAVDGTGRIVDWNAAAERVFGRSAAEVAALTLRDLVRDLDDAGESWPAAGAATQHVVAVRRDGSEFDAEAAIARHEIDGRTVCTLVLRDATERAEAERRARESEARYRSLVEHLPGVVYAARVGRWTPIEYASPQIGDLLGYAPEEWVGIPGMWEEHIHPDDRGRVLGDDDWTVRGEGGARDREYRMRRRDGSEIWVRDHTVVGAGDADGRALRHGYLTDITERKRLEAELVRLAFHDPLTGLANRALLNDRVAKALARTEDGAGLVAMLLIDVDDFKRINDAHGHDVGDRLLVAVARRLRENLRPGTTIARLGGDEFAVLLEELDGAGLAQAVAQRLVTAFEEPFKIEGLQLGARLSVGVAVDIARTRPPAWLLRAADLAMYEAKALGKGRWQAYNPKTHLDSARRVVLESELRRAIEHRQFVLHYQPVRALSTGEIVGSEALLRWNHPKRGIVPPAEFIPTLETSGLIAEVGRWVVDEACRQAAEWSRTLPTIRWTALNVSAAQLRGSEFVQFVRESLARHDVDAARLSIEITESLALDDSPETADLLRRLRELGARIAVDDFGTGYSSLAYLRRLPIDRIKIDRSFVEGVGGDPEANAVVRVIVELARSLHLSTVAEGIEQPSQAQALAELGCDMGQGYLLGRPLEPAALAALVAAQSSRRATAEVA